MGNSSAFGSLARKALAWAIVAVVAILLFKFVVAAVAGIPADVLRPDPARADRVRRDLGGPPTVIYLALAVWFGVATGIVGRIRGSSFFIWAIIGAVVPVIGLVIALAYRSERDEVRRQCPTCGKLVKLHDAMCMRCGTDLDFPEVADRAGIRGVAAKLDSVRCPLAVQKELTSR
jgi:hypothetical protein